MTQGPSAVSWSSQAHFRLATSSALMQALGIGSRTRSQIIVALDRSIETRDRRLELGVSLGKSNHTDFDGCQASTDESQVLSCCFGDIDKASFDAGTPIIYS